MGYTRLYDEAAVLSFMVLDSEPIYFEYDNKNWMIEFWKGQYSLASGFEIGIYYTDRPDLSNEYFNWTLYDCADNENMLKMSFELFKNHISIIKRKGKHWWLTGFKLGEFSQPWELKANVNITFKNTGMRNGFLKGLLRIGYKRNELLINKKTVSFVFDKPKSPQPFTKNGKFDEIIQDRNRELCNRYNDLTKEYDNTLDKIIGLQEIAPDMLEKIVMVGKSKGIFKL